MPDQDAYLNEERQRAGCGDDPFDLGGLVEPVYVGAPGHDGVEIIQQ